MVTDVMTLLSFSLILGWLMGNLQLLLIERRGVQTSDVVVE